MINRLIKKIMSRLIEDEHINKFAVLLYVYLYSYVQYGLCCISWSLYENSTNRYYNMLHKSVFKDLCYNQEIFGEPEVPQSVLSRCT